MNKTRIVQFRRIRHLIRLAVLPACLLLLAGTSRIYGQNEAEQSAEIKSAMPVWLRAHMEFLTHGNGYWIADNSSYKSENELHDAYSMEWRWGIGKQSLIGRLSGLQDGEEIGMFWEFRLVWHPAEKQAIVYQFGREGTFGYGPLRQLDAETNELEQTFFKPDGSSWKGRHHKQRCFWGR